MTKVLPVLATTLLFATSNIAAADNGIVTKASPFSAEATTEKLEATIKAKGFKVFGRLDHAAAAKDAGLAMPYSTVVVYGNPKLGTPNFIDNPPLAIDLPLKALVWEDKEGKVWVSYNSSKYIYDTLYKRHGQPFPPEQVDRFEAFQGSLMDEVVK